jgi:hypothetical protein
MVGKSVVKGDAFVEFVGDGEDCSGHASPAKVRGDQPQAALHREAGGGHVRELLIEQQEILAADGALAKGRSGGGFERHHAQAEGLQLLLRVGNGRRLHRAADRLAGGRLGLVLEYGGGCGIVCAGGQVAPALSVLLFFSASLITRCVSAASMRRGFECRSTGLS